jgi:hypothetical protein
MRILTMTIEATAGTSGTLKMHVAVTISPWVNEPLPDIRGIMCSRDLARLTRRPRWELFGLALIGKFPRKKRYRGRPIGWCKSEVLEWMTRELTVAPESQQRLNTPAAARASMRGNSVCRWSAAPSALGQENIPSNQSAEGCRQTVSPTIRTSVKDREDSRPQGSSGIPAYAPRGGPFEG